VDPVTTRVGVRSPSTSEASRTGPVAPHLPQLERDARGRGGTIIFKRRDATEDAVLSAIEQELAKY